jgi:aminopeptidase
MPNYIDALARLAAGFGANVAPGQTVMVQAKIGQEELARAIAAACYDLGAHHVEVSYDDIHVKRARLVHAPDEALGDVVGWVKERPRALANIQGALISLSGPTVPGLLDDVDPSRIGRDTVPLEEWPRVIAERAVNWAIVPGPNDPWARLVFPELENGQALDRLWQQIGHVCRLDEPDPIAAWQLRTRELADVAARLSTARLDTLHYRGPGTDLHVGLLPGVKWEAGTFETSWGREHLPNIPTEEVFTSPDPERTEGTVTSTKPLVISGRVIEGLRVRFESGRAVEVDADEGAPILQELLSLDREANRLGEVALVDGSGRIGRLDTVFQDTLLDENAASHIALGSGFTHLADSPATAARINHSAVHEDFMIGGPGVDVTATTCDGREIPVLIDGRWEIP